MLNFIAAHWVSISFIGAYLFVGLVSCLPQPGDQRPVSEKLYETLYLFLHLISNKAVERNPKLAAVLPPPK